MLKRIAAVWSGLLLATPLVAADVTYRKDIAPLWHAQCVACHGAQSPYLGEFLENEKTYRSQTKGPRMDTYADLIFFIGWPDTGAIMRRLDDGSSAADRKPGNMYEYLGASEEERQRNLKVFKAWIGEGAGSSNAGRSGALFADGGLFAVAPDQVALHEAEHFMKVKASSVALARRTMREVDGAVLEKFI